MSGTTSTMGPTQCCGSFFYDNTVTVAAALDLQTALQAAVPMVLAANASLPIAQQALSGAQQALADANYFLSGDLRGLPTSPVGLPSGASWNNGGVITLVQ